MKIVPWLLLAFGLLLAQVQPVPAAMRIPAGRLPCNAAQPPCHAHDPSDAPTPCAVCVSCGFGGYLAVLTTTVVPATALTPTAQVVFRDEIGLQWRDPPPLPPPRPMAG